MQATPNPVELLREYLRNTPAHELAADWAAVEALGIEGPTLSEVLSLSTQFYPVLPPEKCIEQPASELLPIWEEFFGLMGCIIVPPSLLLFPNGAAYRPVFAARHSS